MSYRTIEFHRDEEIATIRLQRPERMNAVDEVMYGEIGAALEEARDAHDVRCVILTGSVLEQGVVSKQAFCAGADLKTHSAGQRSREQQREYIRLAHATAQAIWEFPGPVLAAVNGPARGAGTELALACDLMLIADSATLALPETGLGTFVGGGVTYILPRLVGLARARELIYTGRVVDSREAVDLGLALSSHPLDRLLPATRALAREIASKAPISIALAKRHLGDPQGGLAAALRGEAESILRCMETDDWREGALSFVEKRKPRFTGK